MSHPYPGPYKGLESTLLWEVPPSGVDKTLLSLVETQQENARLMKALVDTQADRLNLMREELVRLKARVAQLEGGDE